MKELQNMYENIRKKTAFQPEAALVLGSGLGNFAETIRIEKTLDYREIDGFPVSTVPGHKGRFIFGYVDDLPVVIMQGRVHYYEGYSMREVTLPIRLMGLMGARVLFLTNASGGVNMGYQAGDFMMIQDHISCMIPSPLIGPNDETLGPRFPDMSDPYDSRLREIIRRTAEAEQIPLKEGVYLQLTGPAYETPAEIRMARAFGADAVGMSTVCEAIAANHMGMKVCGISCITNMASGILPQPLSHSEVQETADRVAPLFERLVRKSLTAIYHEYLHG
ncbi:purine-nucleoside phosphorylase [bacterium 1XD42-94]|jgi:purine-nucleoside phosphorylase|nr:purine-nucleoside phosphorylase [bacterium 1XD42-76]NBK04423.1 purine-nucleoside phosphorylase [bacterium 1XD42-94]